MFHVNSIFGSKSLMILLCFGKTFFFLFLNFCFLKFNEFMEKKKTVSGLTKTEPNVKMKILYLNLGSSLIKIKN